MKFYELTASRYHFGYFRFRFVSYSLQQYEQVKYFPAHSFSQPEPVSLFSTMRPNEVNVNPKEIINTIAPIENEYFLHSSHSMKSRHMRFFHLKIHLLLKYFVVVFFSVVGFILFQTASFRYKWQRSFFLIHLSLRNFHPISSNVYDRRASRFMDQWDFSWIRLNRDVSFDKTHLVRRCSGRFSFSSFCPPQPNESKMLNIIETMLFIVCLQS